MIEPIFKVEKICKSFSGHAVLKDISLDILPGEIIGIIGASGSGKTTLLNILIGFIQPDSGDVKFRLNHLLSFKDNSIYRSVYEKQNIVKTVYGFASQLPSLYDELTAQENLEYFGNLHNLSADAIKANADTLLSLMNLQHAANIQAKNLSGGMKRRLDIACSLMHDPDVLILDEPTSDLDPINRQDIWNLVQKINKKGTTIILSSHHLTELEHLCDRIAILKENEIIATDNIEKLKQDFADKQELVFESKPGKYKQILKKIPKKSYSKYNIESDGLHIFSKNIEKVLVEVIGAVKTSGETLKFIKVVRASLDDVFINIINKQEESKK